MRKKYRIMAALCAAFLLTCAFSTVAYAGGGGEISTQPPVTVIETPAPEPSPQPNPFTPSGTGTVVDTATDEDGKVFYTIMTPDENVFYLVIDTQRNTENVYFLNAVTIADLMALAEIPAAPEGGAVVTPTPPVEETPTPTPAPEPEAEKGGGGFAMFAVIAVILLLGGGAGWYFKVYRPKQQRGAASEEMDYTPEDEAGYDDWDTEPEDEADAAPPWDEDESEGNA